MATPLKPWERGGSGYRPPVQLGGAAATVSGNGERKGDGSFSPQRPAVPPRPGTAGTTSYGNSQSYNSYSPNYGQSYTGYNSYGSVGSYASSYPSSYGYSRPYGMNMYGGGGGYGGGGYGGYGNQYGNQYGYGSQYGAEDSQMVRQAEERTRDAFQSVESVVGAFASVSMMLESTYVAVHSSFRALLGVAQHFSRLRSHIWGILSAISILRRVRNWLRWLLSILRVRQYAATDEAWDDASDAFANATQSSQRLWPLVMFCTVIIGVPWLLWRLLSSVLDAEETSSESPQQWTTNGANSTGSTAAKALYNFTAENNNELSLTAGDELVVAPRQFQPSSQGWILVGGRNRKSGIVPVNYVEFLSDRDIPSQSRPNSASSGAGHIPSLTNTTFADD